MNISQLITGIVLVVGGATLIIGAFFSEARVVMLIYGIPLFIIGIYVLFNKKEDKIEQIKKRR